MEIQLREEEIRAKALEAASRVFEGQGNYNNEIEGKVQAMTQRFTNYINTGDFE